MSTYDLYSRQPIPGYDAWKTQGPPEAPEDYELPALSIEVIHDPTDGENPFQVVYYWTEDRGGWARPEQQECEYIDFKELPSDAEDFQTVIEDALWDVRPGVTFHDFSSIDWAWSFA